MKVLNKICTKCKLDKVLNDFPKCKLSKDGKRSWCTKCQNVYSKEYKREKRWLVKQKNINQRINLPDEVWLPIVGYEGKYEVSDKGRVYSIKYGTIMFQSKKKCTATYECRTVKLQNEGNIKGFGVHRLVALAHIPNPNNLPEVDHIDNDPTNNNKNNLQWSTKGDQIRWAYERGRDRKGGDKAHTAKFTNEQVKELRLKYKNGVRFFELKKQYSISETSLCSIIKNKTYKDAI